MAAMNNRAALHALFPTMLLASSLALAGQETGSSTPAFSRLADVKAGSLLLATDQAGLYLSAPVVDTDVQIKVTGLIARTTVEQRFWNPTGAWVEGLYAFPLPENAAVDHLTMTIGDRRIEGEIHEREEARRTYEQAKANGQKASLLEQARPNLFTTAVANLGPDEAVVVRIEMQQELRYDAGRVSLRFPLVAAPRYTPQAGSPAASAGAAAAPAAPEVEVASGPPSQPLSLSVRLVPGFALRRLASPSHPIRARELGRRSWSVDLAQQVVPADRDFVLEWEPDLGRAPGAGLFSEEADGAHYGMVMVLPPAYDPADFPPQPREMIFVLDTSGSMAGTSIRQAKSALDRAFDLLRPEDRFNVITFSDTASRLFVSAVAATPENLQQASSLVEGIDPDGGTEMLAALTAALDEPGAAERLRQVVFITDGEVSNEEQLFAYIQSHLGASRLFTVGIGSAPNSFFMTKAAEAGRGTFTYIGDLKEVATKMGELLARLSLPLLTDVELDWGPVGAEGYPTRVPDLYFGEPIAAVARLSEAAQSLTVRGRLAGAPWETVIPIAGELDGAGLDKLWARRKIGTLETRLATEGLDEDGRASVRQEIVDLALAHHLVSRFTSLVAVDVTPTAPAGTTLAARNVPLSLPAGWVDTGALPQGATSWRRDLFLGLLLAATAAFLLRLERSARR